MNNLTIIQVALAILLVVLILFQNRGAGLGSSWGGSGEFYVTRRGLEKLLFRTTILVAIAFVAVSFVLLIHS